MEDPSLARSIYKSNSRIELREIVEPTSQFLPTGMRRFGVAGWTLVTWHGWLDIQPILMTALFGPMGPNTQLWLLQHSNRERNNNLLSEHSSHNPLAFVLFCQINAYLFILFSTSEVLSHSFNISDDAIVYF